jgi:Asp-tRNA(Asn)/Glu-tRNA(Gln) amidotransferase A subunit family amidase
MAPPSPDRALSKVNVLALPTVRNIAPPVEDVPADPTETILARMRRDCLCLQHQPDELHRSSGARGVVDDMPISLQLAGNLLTDILPVVRSLTHIRLSDRG